MSPPILLAATMNTKGAEALYLDRAIRAGGAQLLSMDLSMRYGEGPLKADITADEVARAGGSSLKELSGSRDMAANMETMVGGASLIASKLMADGKIGGIIGIGGYTGTFVITPVMQVLPFGLPKVMVSSAAAMRGLSSLFLKTSDIMFFHSVVEIAGLPNLVRNILERAACAVCAMVRGPVVYSKIAEQRAVAMTMMSPCEKCASFVRSALETEGYEVVGFHANGVGDRAMEEMIGAGHFDGVIDLAPGGVGENLYGFARDSGPDRLEAAGKRGVPQIISTCGVNHVTPMGSHPAFSGRPRYELDRLRTWLRATPGELRKISEVFAFKLNRSVGPVKVVIPLRGWSSVDSPGNPTYDPEGDIVFSRTLRKKLKREIEIVEVDANMEDIEFSRAIVNAASELFDGHNATS